MYILAPLPEMEHNGNSYKNITKRVTDIVILNKENEYQIDDRECKYADDKHPRKSPQFNFPLLSICLSRIDCPSQISGDHQSYNNSKKTTDYADAK